MTCLCWVSVLAFHTQNFSLVLDKGYLGFGPKNQKIGFNIVDVQSNEIATQRLTYQKKTSFQCANVIFCALEFRGCLEQTELNVLMLTCERLIV